VSTAKIMLIESDRASVPSFSPALEKKGFQVSVTHEVSEALQVSAKKAPDLLILDAASMRTSGSRMCRRIRAELDGVPIVLVSAEGSPQDPGSGASITLVQPFTARKLLNRVDRLLPGDDSQTIKAGPIKLDLARRRVTCHAKESRLTPKQVKLLKTLMQNSDKVMTRKRLMRLVWNTDYLGDTRTLDVHISWLRKAIELDPSEAKLLKTIRGMGYQLLISGGD
jgi:DNA-binding response OmpR family regulator